MTSKYLILALAVLVAGCSASIDSRPSQPEVPTGIHGEPKAEIISQMSVGNGAEEGEVIEFKLKDGTRCVEFASFKTGAGITCEWHREQAN